MPNIFTPTEPADEVRGKVTIVTGAASGIGHAIAELLHSRGAKVVVTDINPAVEEMAADGLVAVVADVTKDGSAEAAVAAAIDNFGRLDILVNNAGYINYQNLVDTSREEWEKVMAINVTGYFLHAREALKAMIPNGRGAIVNIASYASFFAFEGIAPYAASKGAVAQLTRALALEAINHGIRVNAVGSGDVVTHLLDTFRDDGEEFLTEHGQGAPIGRAADAREIAEVVAFLASDRASFIVGSVVMADGGYSVPIK